jgi:hypothetical protein
VNQVAQIVQDAYHRYCVGSGWENGRDGRWAKKVLAELDGMAAEGRVDDPLEAIARAIKAFLDDPGQARDCYQITKFWKVWGYYVNGPGGPKRPRRPLNPGPPRGPDGKFLF